MREFDTGATRDDDTAKPDYDGFLSPSALVRYGEYMNSHRVQADGKTRDSDNWQKGIPLPAYMKSLWRHMVDTWRLHRGNRVLDQKDGHQITSEESLCAIIFNAFGYLHELTKDASPPLPGSYPEEPKDEPEPEGCQGCTRDRTSDYCRIFCCSSAQRRDWRSGQ